MNRNTLAFLLLAAMATSAPPSWAAGDYLFGDGARFLYAPRQGFRVKVGACQFTKKMLDPDQHGADLAFRDSDGVSLRVQAEWDWSRGGKPDHFGVGLSHVNFDVPRFDSDRATDTFNRAYVQADIQYVKRPGGTGNIPGATVLGVQFGVSL